LPIFAGRSYPGLFQAGEEGVAEGGVRAAGQVKKGGGVVLRFGQVVQNMLKSGCVFSRSARRQNHQLSLDILVAYREGL
jgi:hypothetical protein